MSLFNTIRSSLCSLVLACGISGYARAQESMVSVWGARESEAYGGVSAEFDLNEDVSLSLDALGVSRRYALGEARAYGLVAGGGSLGEDYGAFGGLDESVLFGDRDLSLNIRGRLTGGYGNDPFGDEGMVSLGAAARIEISSEFIRGLKASLGCYGQAFSAGNPSLLEDLNGDVDLDLLSRALVFSEDRFGAYASLRSRFNLGSFDLISRVEHLWEVVNWDASVWAKEFFDVSISDADWLSPRNITRAEALVLYKCGGLRLYAGGFGQYVSKSASFESPLLRNGFSTGIVGGADYAGLGFNVQARWYPESEVYRFFESPDFSFLASIGYKFKDDGISARAQGGVAINMQRNSVTGLLDDGVVVFAGIDLGFGGSKKFPDFSYRSSMFDYVRAEVTKSQPSVSSNPSESDLIRLFLGSQKSSVNFVPANLLSLGNQGNLSDLFKGETNIFGLRDKLENDPLISDLYDSVLDNINDVLLGSGLEPIELDYRGGPSLALYGSKLSVKILPSKGSSKDVLDGIGLNSINLFSGSSFAVEGAELSFSSDWDLARLMQGSGRAVLEYNNKVYVFRAPWVEGVMRYLGYRSFSRDLHEPFHSLLDD